MLGQGNVHIFAKTGWDKLVFDTESAVGFVLESSAACVGTADQRTLLGSVYARR